VGKTHLAIALGLPRHPERLQDSLFSAADLVLMLEAAQRQGRYSEVMHRAVKRLQAADRRRDRLSAAEPRAATCSSRFVERRYERGAMILTSNLSFGSWDSAFAGDQRADRRDARSRPSSLDYRQH